MILSKWNHIFILSCLTLWRNIMEECESADDDDITKMVSSSSDDYSTFFQNTLSRNKSTYLVYWLSCVKLSDFL